MKRMTLLTVVMILIVAVGAQAQGMRGSADVVKVAPGNGALTAAAGQRVDFEIKLDIQKKWHIYAHGDSNFIGVDLLPVEGFPLTEIKTEYPHGHEGEFFGEKVIMIEGKDIIKASALVPADLAKGEHVMELTVTAQACDDKNCLAPADIPVSFKLTVE